MNPRPAPARRAGEDEALRIELEAAVDPLRVRLGADHGEDADTGLVVSAPLCRFRQTTLSKAPLALEGDDLGVGVQADLRRALDPLHQVVGHGRRQPPGATAAPAPRRRGRRTASS